LVFNLVGYFSTSRKCVYKAEKSCKQTGSL